ncbi:unnamed protein product [Onchocerca flexuosa]|uniref:Ovule protein n=1 Tax=Onchocerca flexuosa TaxID=387005 RepID=A0A183I5D6_9BILA|nr:unnamed protein product [Onchocerca flexuosa]
MKTTAIPNPLMMPSHYCMASIQSRRIWPGHSFLSLSAVLLLVGSAILFLSVLFCVCW